MGYINNTDNMNTTSLHENLNSFEFPSLDLLKTYDNEVTPVINPEEQDAIKGRIANTLHRFGIDSTIKVTTGYVVSLYEIEPKEGVRIAQIKNLEDEILFGIAVEGVRIIAPMPGKGTVGIEVPNGKPQIVSMHSVVASRRFQEEHEMRLPVAIGKTITNEVFMFDLAKAPHLIVGGATGQGKTVCLQTIITSLLYKKRPSELKFVLMDEKMVEFPPYKNLLQHYLAAMPGQETTDDIIVSDCEKAISTLNALVAEMEKRYQLLQKAGCRNIEEYNDKFANHSLTGEDEHCFLPYIVVVIDEYGDFVMQAGRQVETPIARITQKAHAVGMHMILSTQRPSVNIITGVIKANIRTRIAFRCLNTMYSLVVLDAKGAEQLIGYGDMLYSTGSNVTRVQCAYVDTTETENIVKHICEQSDDSAPYE